jgi:hypothetical protein
MERGAGIRAIIQKPSPFQGEGAQSAGEVIRVSRENDLYESQECAEKL